MRSSKIISLILLLSLTVGVLLACDRRPRDEETGLPLSVGSYRRITVLSDSREWRLHGEELLEQLGQRIYTPSLEYIYNVDPVPFDKLKQVKYRKILFFIANLNSNGMVSSFVKENLDQQSIQLAEKEGGKIFFVRDFWAKDQVLIFLVAPERETVMDVFQEYKEDTYSILDKFYTKNVRQGLYNYGEQVDLERKIYKKYGWHFRIPRGYEIIGDHPEDNFIWFRKRSPDRIMFVHWEDAPKSKLTKEYCLEKRDELTFKYYDEDLMVRDKTEIKETEFNGMPGYVMEGFWQNEKYLVGGPFKSYCFYSEKEGRIYMIDTNIFAPGESKYIQQKRLEIIAHTFTTEPVPADRKTREPGEDGKITI